LISALVLLAARHFFRPDGVSRSDVLDLSHK
jgi:hypothetical protein